MRKFSTALSFCSLLLAALLACPALIQGQPSRLPGPVQIIDEGGQSPAAANAGITDRPMSQTINLKKIQAAFDNAQPQDTTKTYGYRPDQIIKVRMREFMQTVVILPEGEEVGGSVIGDAVNFAVDKLPGYKNRFVLFGRDPGADTNLTVFGKTGRIYSFYLRHYSTDAKVLPDLLLFIKDNTLSYEEVAAIAAKETEASPAPTVEKECLDCKREDYPPQQFVRDYLRDLPGVDRKKANHNYVMKGGSRDLAPQAIFDDGYMTYFKYGDNNLDAIKVPVIYQVRDGYDNIANYRIEGGYIVMETVNDKWTIRRGEQYLCIENRKYRENKDQKAMK